MTKILGLDLGTNSVGWALLDQENQQFIATGSRIIPMSADAMADFDNGKLKSAASARTASRLARRRCERAKLRRSRLLRVLNRLGWLPEHFAAQINFSNHPGQFIDHAEPLLAYIKGPDGKNTFLFEDAFREMLADFATTQPGLVAEGKKIPHDWTLYYLRHKALTRPLTPFELSWVLLSFNTKRGYYQLADADEAPDKEQEYRMLAVASVNRQDEDKKRIGYHWYEIIYEGGLIQKVCSPAPPCSVGDVREAIVTTQLGKDGTVKQQKVATPKEVDWTLRKKRTESELQRLGLTVGSYIYTTLLKEPDAKIRGKVVHTIDRANYRQEVEEILRCQANFHPALRDPAALETCLLDLYPRNEPHRRSYTGKTMTEFLTDDVLFYQRPLKSKKSLIDECTFESRVFKDGNGMWQRKPLKCIPKSHPLYAEYRLWQFIANLRLYQRVGVINGHLAADVDVTDRFFPDVESKAELFDWLNARKEISQKTLLAYKPLGLKSKERDNYRWNYQEDKEYPCNPTGHDIQAKATKGGLNEPLDQATLIHLWHILYSVTDPDTRRKALTTFAQNHGVASPEEFASAFRGLKLDEGYGAYSEKAIRKLTALMRQGSRWDPRDIDPVTLRRIEAILSGVDEPSLTDEVREKFKSFREVADFQGLPQWLAAYAVYGRHSEAPDLVRWQSPSDIDTFLSQFRQHSLRNPVVESLVMETLRVVRDIWKSYGDIDEIHVETARNLKQTAKQRETDTKRILDNQAANTRIRRLLQEFAAPGAGVADVRPYSPSQQEILKIYEQTVLDDPDAQTSVEYREMAQIASNLGRATTASKVSHADIIRYKLWLEQHYCSPYTGQPIPISKLFTPAYQIEHVIPQSRFFDDALSNKVICEAAVNKDKGPQLAYQYIMERGGSIIETGFGYSVRLFSPKDYEQFVKKHYGANRAKMRKLLMEEIPEEFAERQMNDTRYMTRYILSLLSHMVREADETAAVSKHVLPTSGSVTDHLKSDWGLNDVWADLMAPRFKRLNEITGSTAYGEEREKDGKRFFKCDVPDSIKGNFSLKRIDHRHHALDAMVIACTSRNAVAYLNNAAAADSSKQLRYDLRAQLCDKTRPDADGNYRYIFKKPWPTFTQDVRTALGTIVVSVKKNLRTLTRTSNHTQCINPDGSRALQTQQGHNFAVRKPLHKDSVFGSRPGTKKGEWYSVIRKPILGFTAADVAKVYNADIRNILLRHLDNYQDNPAEAFSPDGIAEMNANIATLNGGHAHKPVYSVKIKEALGKKFPIGASGNKPSKFVEAQTGTILFSAVYEDEQGKRTARHIPFNEVLECRKQQLPVAPSIDKKGRRLVMVLSPGDVVRMPAGENAFSPFYQMISAIDTQILFRPLSWAKVIADGVEYTRLNKDTKDINGRPIRDLCVKLRVDRLGRILGEDMIETD